MTTTETLLYVMEMMEGLLEICEQQAVQLEQLGAVSKADELGKARDDYYHTIYGADL